jgi:predicted amidophosphoribosyltransferase
MWIRNKRTGQYECLSPAEAKYKIRHHPNIFKDTQSKYCKDCGAENHREKTHCKICGKPLV